MAAQCVIVADPCPDNRESLAMLLRLHGLAVEEASTLSALVAHLWTTRADLVVTEIFGDPGATHAAIRSAAREATIAFHTTWSQPDDVLSSEALGCRHFIKATHTESLVRWITVRESDRRAENPRLATSPPPGQARLQLLRVKGGIVTDLGV